MEVEDMPITHRKELSTFRYWAFLVLFTWCYEIRLK